MHLLNQAYDQLRRRLRDAENKSKYDVLVQAKEYIQALAALRDQCEPDAKPVDMSNARNKIQAQAD